MTVYGYSAEVARPLTPRMLDVLRAAARGLSAKQTAAELGISEHTVHAVRAALCARLGAVNVTAAVDRAHRLGALS